MLHQISRPVPVVAVVAAVAGTLAGVLIVRRRAKQRRIATRYPVNAFYLMHPSDDDELPFLEAARASLSSDVNLTWGNELTVAPRDVNVFIKRLPTDEELDAWSTLKMVLIPFAGPTEKTQALLRARPHLSLHNAHYNATSTAEMAIALLLATAKTLVVRDQAFRKESEAGDAMWTPGFMEPSDAPPTPVLAGRVALVLGYGASGARVAQALAAMGMEVLACRRRTSATPVRDGVATVYGIGSLADLLPRASVLVLCLPGTKETSGLIGAHELARLPRGALLVNVGRGAVVDEAALYASLTSGHLAGAGLDVWWNYPMLPGQVGGLEAGGRAAHSLGLPLTSVWRAWLRASAVFRVCAVQGRASDQPRPVEPRVPLPCAAQRGHVAAPGCQRGRQGA